MNADAQRTPMLGQTLLDFGSLSNDQLQIALQEQRRQHRLLGRLIVTLGFASEHDVCRALARNLGKNGIDLRCANIGPQALSLVPLGLARQHKLIPVDYAEHERRLILAVSDPSDIVGLDKVRALLGDNVEIDAVLAGDAEIEQAIDRHYGHELAIDSILRELEYPAGSAAPDFQAETAAPIIRLVDALLIDAIKSNASDIHFEPGQHSLRIRYRIDGLLRGIRVLHASLWAAMAVRIKVMAGLNIAETRAAQDGHLSLTVSGRPIDLRVSSQPTLHGENVVLRILDRSKGIVPLNQLGLSAPQLGRLTQMLNRPEGILLVTGPTGSGKTSTLYSILQHIEREEIHIMTLEDPVEYPLERIRQTSVGDALKIDFASGIRSMLRQDPDVMLIGEIRDTATAEMAFRAALTGHQVYSTLHASSAVGAIPRLLDLGIRPEIMAGNTIGIVAQRLVRQLCPNCRQTRPLTQDEIGIFQRCDHDPPDRLHLPGGCRECAGTGYRGRLPIMEILRFDRQIDERVAKGASNGEILDCARQSGFVPLIEDGLRLVTQGLTSFSEIGRVTDLTGAI